MKFSENFLRKVHTLLPTVQLIPYHPNMRTNELISEANFFLLSDFGRIERRKYYSGLGADNAGKWRIF